jgi:hypothetical protein
MMISPAIRTQRTMNQCQHLIQVLKVVVDAAEEDYVDRIGQSQTCLAVNDLLAGQRAPLRLKPKATVRRGGHFLG